MMGNKWPVKQLGDICEVLNGFAFKSDKYVDKGVRVIRITNVQHGYIEDNEPKFYPKNECDRLHQYMLKENDLLMSLTGNVGRVGLLDGKYLPAALNQRVACLRIKSDNVELKYLFHHLNSELFETRCIQSAKGIAQKNMSTEWLKEYPIPIPPLSEQARIVEELDQLSNIIEKKRQQLSELDNLAQSIFYDMFGDPVTNEKGWEVKKLGEVGFFARGVSKHRPRNAPELMGGSMPLIQTGDVANSGMYITDYNSTYSELGVQQSKVWEAGTLCITIAATIGKCSILTFDACFPDSVVGYIGKKEFICNEYVYYLFGCLQSILEANAPAVAQKNINLKVLNLLEVPLPPLELQKLFAQKIEAIEKEKELIKQSIKETEELFNSRMDYYFG